MSSRYQPSTRRGIVSGFRTKGRKQPDTFGTSKTGPPSYAFQNNQRGQQDDESSKTAGLRKEEEQLQEEGKEGDADKKDFKDGKPPKIGPVAPKTTADVPTPPTLKSAFAKCWTIVDELNMPLYKEPTKSSYLPNSIAIFEILHHMEVILNDNEELKWKCPFYFSLPVRIYYAVMFYVQILRAKQESGKLTTSEGSWLRAFFRRYKETSLPIAGPLVPPYSNIVSCLPDNAQYNYVYPNITSEAGYYTSNTDTINTIHVNSSHALIPSVQLLMCLFDKFKLATHATNATQTDAKEFVPFKVSAGGEIAACVFPIHVADAPNVSTASLLNNPAVMHSLPESQPQLKALKPYWLRSQLKEAVLPTRTMAAGPAPVPPVVQHFTGIQGLTMMDTDFDWFEPCIEMASIQAKFFTDSTNFSNIPTIGGMSSLIIADLKVLGTPALPTVVNEWYPETYNKVTATFTSHANDIELESVFQAGYCLTNATLEWVEAAGHKIGSHASGSRTGPYDDGTQKVTYKNESETRVMTGIHSMLQTQFYDCTGNE